VAVLLRNNHVDGRLFPSLYDRLNAKPNFTYLSSPSPRSYHYFLQKGMHYHPPPPPPPPHLKVISQRCAFGAIRKKFSNSVLSGVVDSARRAPLHSRKKNATAYRSSMRARWIPTQDLAPAPNGWKAVFAAGESASARPSFEDTHRYGLKLFRTR